jgi:hypothetical protein
MTRRFAVVDSEAREERCIGFSMFQDQHVLGGRGALLLIFIHSTNLWTLAPPFTCKDSTLEFPVVELL